MDSNSCSTFYKSGRGSYDDYSKWNEKFTELLNVEHSINLSREDRMLILDESNYKQARNLIRDRDLSHIGRYKQVIVNFAKVKKLREEADDRGTVIDLNRAIAAYENYLHTEGVPFTMNTTLEISIPSGTIVMTDNFVENFAPDGSYEGQSAWMHNLSVGYMNDYKIATARVDGFPEVLRKNGNDFVIADREGHNQILDGETLIDYKRTGLYDYSIELMDYDNWLDKVGTRLEESNSYSLVNVTPGVYLWTVYSHNQEFYEGYYDENYKSDERKVYAELTFVRGL